MTFLIYKTVNHHGQVRLQPADEIYKLPYLLQEAWHRKGKPIEAGWDVSAGELIRIHSGDRESYQTARLLSDFHPSSKTRIGLVEILHIYAFTWGDTNAPEWTPFMIRGRDVFYKDDYEELSESAKRKEIADLPEFSLLGKDFAEFLYSRVNKYGTWVWGRTGMTNAAFLQGEALRFFQKALFEVSCSAHPTAVG